MHSMHTYVDHREPIYLHNLTKRSQYHVLLWRDPGAMILLHLQVKGTLHSAKDMSYTRLGRSIPSRIYCI